MTGLLRLRSSLTLVEKRPSKRLYYDGPVVTRSGLCLTRPFDCELVKVDSTAGSVLFRVSTGPRLFEFTAMQCPDGERVVGVAGNGVAAFREDTGELVWERLDLRGVTFSEGAPFSTDEGCALVELNAASGSDVRRLPLVNEHPAGFPMGALIVLMPRHPLLDDGNRSHELARQYRCVSLETGKVLWERNLAKLAWEAAGQAPHFIRNLVPGSLGESWIGRWRESTFACSRGDGRLLWLAKDVECGLRADVKGGRVFGMATGGGWFYVLDERTGALLSKYDGAGLEGAAYPRPAALLGEYAVYGMESGHLAVFDPRNGQLVWATRHKAPVSDVRVIEGLVYVVTGKGELLVYEPTAPVPGL